MSVKTVKFGDAPAVVLITSLQMNHSVQRLLSRCRFLFSLCRNSLIVKKNMSGQYEVEKKRKVYPSESCLVAAGFKFCEGKDCLWLPVSLHYVGERCPDWP